MTSDQREILRRVRILEHAEATGKVRSPTRKREQLRSGKPPSAQLTFTVRQPKGECRLSLAGTADLARHTERKERAETYT
jgi:hypothetical protein